MKNYLAAFFILLTCFKVSVSQAQPPWLAQLLLKYYANHLPDGCAIVNSNVESGGLVPLHTLNLTLKKNSKEAQFKFQFLKSSKPDSSEADKNCILYETIDLKYALENENIPVGSRVSSLSFFAEKPAVSWPKNIGDATFRIPRDHGDVIWLEAQNFQIQQDARSKKRIAVPIENEHISCGINP